MIININETWGMPVKFETPFDMAETIRECGYDVTEEDLVEGIDYEVID